MIYKYLFGFVVLTSVLSTIDAAVSVSSTPSTHPGKKLEKFTNFRISMMRNFNSDFPGMCYDPFGKKGYPVGESTIKGSCVRFSCNSDFTYDTARYVKFDFPNNERINKLISSSHSCGVMSLDAPGYELRSDHSKPYPDCCPKPVKIE